MNTGHQLKYGDAPFKMIVAGAGTGGHLFPGIAVAETLLRQKSGAQVLFVTTGKPIEKTVLSRFGFAQEEIRASGIKGKKIGERILSLMTLPAGLLRSLALLFHFRPDVVIGMGGYSAAPVMVAARLLGIPRVIHEQNRLPGLTNRVLSRFADRVYVSFPDTRLPAAEGRIRFTGNPVREEIRRECGSEASEANTMDTEKRFTLLVLGGSQGAHAINIGVVAALEHLKDPGTFHFIHQTGVPDAGAVEAAYAEKKISATVSAFFNDMGDRYRQADLVICRAGASTVAELAAVGRPAIFIPFPHAADNHQVLNAAGIVEAGAADMMEEKDLTGKALAERIDFYAANPEELAARRAAISRFCGSDAAETIVADMLGLIGAPCENDSSEEAG